MICHFEFLPIFIRHNEGMTDNRSCHFEGGTTEKSVAIVRDFSSFFVEMTQKINTGIPKALKKMAVKLSNSCHAQLLSSTALKDGANFRF